MDQYPNIDRSNSSLMQCENCLHHFQIDPRGSTQDAACPDCGGTRMFREQPSPTVSDGTLRNMVDSDTEKDAGGNPLKEGVIMGDDGERPFGKRDNYMHGHVLAALVMGEIYHPPVSGIKCPDCGGQIALFPGMHEIYCTNCDRSWDAHTDEPEGDHHYIPEQLGDPWPQKYIGDDRMEGFMPIHKDFGRIVPHYQGSKVAGEMEDILGLNEPPKNNLNWTPGMKGRGLLIGGEPHTWNTGDPKRLKTVNDPATIMAMTSPNHTEYVERLGINPEHVDWNSGIEIDPNGSVLALGEHDPSRFIASDPRLKLIEDPFMVASNSKFEQFTNNMEPYDSWQHTADVLFNKGPDQNIPAHSISVIPGKLGLHNNTLHYLNFLGAHINGVPVRGNQGDLMRRHGLRQSPDFGQPVVVSVHDPSHIPAAVDQIQYEGVGPSPRMKEVGLKVQAGELPPPPGINPSDIAPPQNQTVTAAFLAPLLPEAIAPVAEGVGAANMLKDVPVVGGLMNKALGMGGSAQPANQGTSLPPNPLAPTASILEAFVSHYETPTSNPDVGTKHDDPEEVDQKEFNDQDKSPKNPLNPNNEDNGPHGSTSGEDGVKEKEGFADNSPAIERLNSLLQLVLHFYNSDDSGANDPMLKALDEMLEGEMPGYKDKGDPEATDKFIIGLKTPEHVHSNVPPIQGITEESSNTAAPPQIAINQQGRCPNCGGALDGIGGCPQCGANSGNTQVQQMNALPGGNAFQSLPSKMPVTVNTAGIDIISSLIEGATHQGPVTPQQIAAVQQWLISHGRTHEVPNVPIDPGNPEYVKILSEIQGNPNIAPTISPEEQTPPPPQPGQQEMAPGGAMPVPGMAPGEGSQPMSPMSSFLPDFLAADNIADRCPNCGSATTGMVGDEDHTQYCHSCHHKWKKDVLDDNSLAGSTSISSVHQSIDSQNNEQSNPVGIPAQEQDAPHNRGYDQDSSLTWQDTEGNPLQAGQEYLMHSPRYDIPDMIRVNKVKPDGIEVEAIGTFSNEPDALRQPEHITREELDSYKFTFEPVAQNADQRNNEPPPGSQAPGYQQVPPSGQTTDEHDNSYPPYQSSVNDGICSKCGHDDKESFMLSATKTAHSCYYCGNTWTEEEETEGDEHHLANREWVLDDEDDDFTERMQAMAKARQQSRNVHDIAEKDSRLQAIKDHLNSKHQERTAGKHFTPSEQRALIDEDGVARNSDLLDLAGTHYREDYTGKANGDNVPAEHILFGLV